MNWHRIYAVGKKDITEAWKQKGVKITIILALIILCIGIPAFAIIAAHAPAQAANSGNSFMTMLPSKAFPKNLAPQYYMAYLISLYVMTPVVLILVSYLVALIGAPSFVGERVSLTAEGLIYTPITTNELITAKCLACLLPTLILSWGTMIIQAIIMDCFSIPFMHIVIFPNFISWITGIFLVPLTALLVLGVDMLVSQHVKTEKAARAVGGLVIIPVYVLMMTQYEAVVLSNKLVLILILVVIAIIDFILFIFVFKDFDKTSFLFKN